MKLQLSPAWLLGVGAMLLALGTDAQDEPTGSHAGAKTSPTTVVQFTEPDEVERIRRLLNEGRKEAALEAARSYVVKVEATRLQQDKLPRYYAYNALCTVLTSVGRLEEAVALCTSAMEAQPAKWSAINNRGTAHLLAGDYRAALEDYRRALEVAPDGNEAIADTIGHNIRLAEQRRDAR